MFNLKKYFTDELLQVALILSLLRIDRRSLEYNVPAIGIGTNNLSDSWDQPNILVRREGGVHPKSIDSILINYEQEVFHELNSLGRYSPIFNTLNSRNLTAYLLNVGDSQTNDDDDDDEEEEAASSMSPDHRVLDENVESNLNLEYPRKNIDSGQLSQEDLDVIETLWKYDVFVENDDSKENVRNEITEGSVSPPDEPFAPDGSRSLTPELIDLPESTVPRNVTTSTDWKKIVSNENEKEDVEEDYAKSLFTDELLGSDPWIGASSSLAWLSDREDNKNIRKTSTSDSNATPLINDDEDVPSSAIFGPEFSLEETLQLIDLNEVDQNPLDLWQLLSVKTEAGDTTASIKKEEEEETEIKEDPGIEADFIDEELDLFANILHDSASRYSHPPSLQNQTLLSSPRTVSMDHRWQDSASAINLRDTNHFSVHNNYHSQFMSNDPSYSSPHHGQHDRTTEASLRNGLDDVNDVSVQTSSSNSNSRGTTLVNSVNLIDDIVNELVITTDNSALTFKVEPNREDMVYPYQNSGNEMNQTTDGFLSSILSADDMHFVDMAMNNSICSSMRMFDDGCCAMQNCFERGTDSDSAVSSMGSERVPSSSSDNEWMETNSDSGHTPADYYENKYSWYENFMSDTRATGENSPNNTSSRRSPTPQKECQYDKKCTIQDQITNAHICHNHTYHTPSVTTTGVEGTVLKPLYRDKSKFKSGRKSEDDQLTRDEKKARNQNIPISVYDIINLPMDEFNEKLSTYDLSENQLSLIRDIRRRGKNKVAAQNCRKRKLDQIMNLADEVKNVKDTKHKLLQEKEFLNLEQERIQSKYHQLNRHILQSLRNSGKNLYSSYAYTLHPTEDGNVIIVPRTNGLSNSSHDMDQSSAHNPQSKNEEFEQ